MYSVLRQGKKREECSCKGERVKDKKNKERDDSGEGGVIAGREREEINKGMKAGRGGNEEERVYMILVFGSRKGRWRAVDDH